mgnify:CR=1 FL=1
MLRMLSVGVLCRLRSLLLHSPLYNKYKSTTRVKEEMLDLNSARQRRSSGSNHAVRKTAYCQLRHLEYSYLQPTSYASNASHKWEEKISHSSRCISSRVAKVFADRMYLSLPQQEEQPVDISGSAMHGHFLNRIACAVAELH